MRLLRLPARFWTIILGSTAALLALGCAARLLLPLMPLGPAPALISTIPLRGADDVLPRSTITLSFAGPMNRSSVLRSLQITPPTPGRWQWAPDAQTLTFTPADGLAPAATYTVTLGAAARDRWWRPLPVTPPFTFQTAPQPAVLAALPAGPDTPRTSSFALTFSQPMVAPETVGRDLAFPHLSFSPALPYQARWIAVDTLLIRPTAPLPAAQPYTATLAANLADARGIALGTPFRWRFSTAWPSVGERTPPPGARAVGPRSPLSFTFDSPVDQALIRAALTISPPIPGDLVAELRGTAQVVTFTPRRDWAPETTYTISLQPPAGSNLAEPPDLRWRFTVEPRPELVAFFPGQGQFLPAGQAIRLVFTTPMDAATLAAGISFDPPVAAVPISVSNTEARLTPQLAPSTPYTITVAAGTPDRTGAPLANPIVVNLRTGPAPPTLRAVDAAVGLITLPVSRTAEVAFERINLDSIDLSLYALDPPTLRLALAGGPTGLAALSPERYSQPLLRRWQVDLDDPPDTLVQSAIAVEAPDGAPLAPGAYLLRATTRVGPRSDVLLVVSSMQLTMRHNAAQVLVWATDTNSGAPRAGAPIALYTNDLLVATGVTDADGVFELPITRNPADALYLAISEGADLAVVRADWALDPPDTTAQPTYQALIWPDQSIYAPDTTVRVNGRVRRLAANGDLLLPGALTCRLQLSAPGAPPPSLRDPACRVAANGRLTATAQLNAALMPGDYRLRVSIGDTVIELPLRVDAVDSFGTTLSQSERSDAGLILQAVSGNLPLSDAQVLWNLAFTPLPSPGDDAAAGFSFALPDPPRPPLTGSAVTDAAGRVTIPLPSDIDQPVQYRLIATLSAPGASSAQLATSGLLDPADRTRVGIRLPAQFVTDADRAVVELLVRDAAGNPIAGRPVELTVTRAGAADGPPLLSRRVASGPTGRVDAQLVPLNPGVYTLSATAGGAPSRATLWVTARNYRAWDNPTDRVTLIPERPQYAVGDTARLLITSPWPTATLLLTRERGILRADDVQILQAGQVITFTVTPDLAPGFALGAILTTGAERRIGSVTVPITSAEPPLTLSVAADRANYLPGATATLSVTLPAAVPAADLLVALEPATTPDLEPTTAGFMPQAPQPLAVAGHPPTASMSRQPAISYQAGPPGFLVSGDVGAGGPGLATLQIPLPNESGAWRVTVYAIDGAARVTRAATVVTVNEPLISTLLAPPYLRPGDTADLVLELTNTVAVTRSLQVNLNLAGATLTTPAAAEQQVLLAPNSTQIFTWRLTPNPDAPAVTARVRFNDGANTALERTIAILPASSAPPRTGATISTSGPLEITLPADSADTAALTIAVAPSLPAALADVIAPIEAAAAPSTVEQAARALIAARLTAINNAPEADRWRETARNAVTALLAEQNNDGGWGWWPDLPSDPFVSAFVVEALAVNRPLFSAARPDSRALAYLERTAAAAEPNLRAYMGFAAARAGQALPTTAALIDSELDPAGLAYLALALPTDASAPVVERLSALSSPPWPVSAASGLPDTPAAVTAAVVEALRSRNPGAPARAAAETALTETWSIDGWGGAFSAARVAAAIPLRMPATEEFGPRRITLNDQILFNATAPLTTPLRLQVTPTDLRAPLELTIAADGAAPYLLAYGTSATTEPARAPAAIVSVSYHDPATGALIDPTQLRAGQLIDIRLQTIAMQPIDRAQLTLDLPAAFIPLETMPGGAVIQSRIHAAAAQVDFFAPRLSAGFSQQSILARVVARGSFAVPPPYLAARDNTLPGPIIPLAPAQILSQ